MASRRAWIGVRASVGLTFLAAVLSVATGIVYIDPATVPSGPLTVYVPAVVTASAGFTGTLTGFLLLASAFSLRQGYRIGWYATVLLLPLAAAHGLLQASETAAPLVIVSLAAELLLLVNLRRFRRELDFSATQLAAVVAIVSAQVYGTAGTFALRDQFAGVDSLTDAFYFTIVTGSTVGYGDITPQTEIARVFGVSVLLVSVSSFAVALGVILTPAIEARLTKALGQMTESQLDLLDDHVLVLGYGDLTEPILDELKGVPFIVLTPDSEQVRQLGERGIDALTADPSDVASLERANVQDARAAVAATNDDAQDALAILTARQLNPDLRIVAAATQRENVNKLKRAGADTVISPASIGGHLLVESALGGTETEDIAERLMSGLSTGSGDKKDGR